MACHALDGVVALISCRADGYLDPTPSIHAKLRSMGARVATRLGKDVTHVIFNRRLNPSAQERNLEDADLRMLYDRIGRMDFPVAVVTPLWVSRSQELGRRALEGHFILARPAQPTATEQAIGAATASVTPGSSGRGQTKRPTPRRFRAVLKTENLDLGLDLDSPIFSSSQQLKDEAPWSDDPGGRAGGAKAAARRWRPPLKTPPGVAPLRERLQALSRARQQQQQREAPAATPEKPPADDDVIPATPGSGGPTPSFMPGPHPRTIGGFRANATSPGRLSVRGPTGPDDYRTPAPHNLLRATLPTGCHVALQPQPPRSAGASPPLIDLTLLSPAPSTAALATPKLVGGAPALGRIVARPKAAGPSENQPLPSSSMSNPLFAPDAQRTYNNQVFSAASTPERTAAQMPLVGGASPATGAEVRGAAAAATAKRPTASGARADGSKRAKTTASGPMDRFLVGGPGARATVSTGRPACIQPPRLLPAVSCRNPVVSEGGGAKLPSAPIGMLAATSVTPAEAELLKSAVRKLRGAFRLCPSSKQATHLVVGAERRTLKILQAIAAGTWLLAPDWLQQSMRAGRWLPVEEHQAKVRFSEGASRARASLSDIGGSRLLEGYRVHVADRSGEGKRARSNAEVIRELAAALGADVVPARGCSLCIITGGTDRPAVVAADVPVVEEEWLFTSTERYELVDTAPWLVTA